MHKYNKNYLCDDKIMINNVKLKLNNSSIIKLNSNYLEILPEYAPKMFKFIKQKNIHLAKK